jgi:hypothetical protein
MMGDDRRFFAGLAVPPLPRDVKAATLQCCRAAMAGTKPAPNVWNRMWNHRGLRVGWAASAAALLVFNLGLALGKSLARTGPQNHPAAMTTSFEPEIRAIAELPAIDFRATGRGGPLPPSEEPS